MSYGIGKDKEYADQFMDNFLTMDNRQEVAKKKVSNMIKKIRMC